MDIEYADGKDSSRVWLVVPGREISAVGQPSEGEQEEVNLLIHTAVGEHENRRRLSRPEQKEKAMNDRIDPPRFGRCRSSVPEPLPRLSDTSRASIFPTCGPPFGQAYQETAESHASCRSLPMPVEE